MFAQSLFWQRMQVLLQVACFSLWWSAIRRHGHLLRL